MNTQPEDQISLLDCVREYTYLGICFNSSGSFSDAISKLYEKSLKAMYALMQLALPDMDIKTLLYLFDHTVKPVMLYGAEVWGSSHIKCSEKSNDIEKYLDSHKTSLELKFLKRILQVRRDNQTLQ